LKPGQESVTSWVSGWIALGAVQLKGEFAGQVKPDGDFLFFPRGGVVFGQTVQYIAANEVAEEVGLGGLGDVFQEIDLAAR
jgi:8-oxo-dGTP pyrophosphatase MutT (NUDIX family)